MIDIAAAHDSTSSQRALVTCDGEARCHTSEKQISHALGAALSLQSPRKRERSAWSGQLTAAKVAPPTRSVALQSP